MLAGELWGHVADWSVLDWLSIVAVAWIGHRCAVLEVRVRRLRSAALAMWSAMEAHGIYAVRAEDGSVVYRNHANHPKQN